MNILKKIFSHERFQGGLAGLLISVMFLAAAANASTITTINGSDSISGSRTTINTNFTNLNTDKVELSNTSAWTGLQKLFANASTTGLSAGYAYFGATATTSISNTGVVTLATTTSGCASISGSGILYSNGQPCGTSSATVTSVQASTPNSTLTLGGTNPITTSGTISFDLNLGNSNTWTVLQSFNYASSTIYDSFKTASTTNLIMNGQMFQNLLGTGLSNSSGVLTVAAVPNSALSNSTISGIALGGTLGALTATDSSLTFSGSYTGNTARTIGLNLGNTNTWTVLQNFNYSSSTIYSSFLTSSSTNELVGSLTAAAASTTQVTVATKLYIPSSTTASSTSAGDITIDTTDDEFHFKGTNEQIIYPKKTPGFSIATTTGWTGTTTVQQLPSPFTNQTINAVQCYTDAGTLNVDIYHTTTHLVLLNASTTQGTFGFTTNNTMTPGEKWYFTAGTPASTPTTLTCTFKLSVIGS